MSDTSAAGGPATPRYGASDHYDADYFAWQDHGMAVKVRYKALRFAPHVQPDDVVLDFGCAGGGLLRELNCFRKLGVEINDVARQSAATSGVETFATLEEVPAGVADVVISSHTLEHIPDPFEALKQIQRLIKPGGKLVLLLPIDDWRRGRKYRPGDINHHLHTWTPLLLGNLLSEAGYTVSPEDIKVVRHALMRHFVTFDAKLPRPVFDLLCRVWARVRHAQEIVAVARPAA